MNRIKKLAQSLNIFSYASLHRWSPLLSESKTVADTSLPQEQSGSSTPSKETSKQIDSYEKTVLPHDPFITFWM